MPKTHWQEWLSDIRHGLVSVFEGNRPVLIHRRQAMGKLYSYIQEYQPTDNTTWMEGIEGWGN